MQREKISSFNKKKKANINAAAVAVFSAVVVLVLIVIVGNAFLQSLDRSNLTADALDAVEKTESYMWTGVTILAVGLLILVAAAVFVYIKMLM